MLGTVPLQVPLEVHPAQAPLKMQAPVLTTAPALMTIQVPVQMAADALTPLAVPIPAASVAAPSLPADCQSAPKPEQYPPQVPLPHVQKQKPRAKQCHPKQCHQAANAARRQQRSPPLSFPDASLERQAPGRTRPDIYPGSHPRQKTPYSP